jgi:hypothetical protein
MDNELYKDRLMWATVVWVLVSPIKLLSSTDRWTWACITVAGGILLAAAWLHYYRKPDTAESAAEDSRSHGGS